MSDQTPQQTDDSDGQQDRPGGPSGWVLAVEWGFTGLFHAAMGSLVGLVAMVGMFGSGSLRMMWSSSTAGGYRPDWLAIGGLVAASIALWVMGWTALRGIWRRWSEQTETRTVGTAGRGAVLTETLIVMVPFMMLTSGVAQIAINQSASIMAHYAAYQSARTHWVWHGEKNSLRGSGKKFGKKATESRIKKRAKLAAALVMAPSAPADFTYSGSTGQMADDVRKIMKASFVDGKQKGKDTMVNSGGSSLAGTHNNLSFAKALGGSPFPERASRKLAFAYSALSESGNFELIEGSGGNVSEIGVDFRYPLQQAFPWFAWIHSGSGGGCSQTYAGRQGCYIPINRKATYNEQVGVYSKK